MENSSYSLTSVINYTKEKAKKALYLVLIKKPLSVKSTEKLNKIIESKLTKFFDKIIPKLNEIKPEDPEKFMKYMMLKATFKILEKIMNDNYLKMNEDDRNKIKEIYGSENDENEGEGKDKEKIPKVENTKNE